jgi:peptidoglycan/xylan/chitin deacetylase (PgdA/CDA1 family)
MAISRRTVLGAAAGAAAAAGLAACSPETAARPQATPSTSTDVPTDAAPGSTGSAASVAGGGGATTAPPGTSAASTSPGATDAPGTLPPTDSSAPAGSGAPARFVNHGDRNGTTVALTFHASGDVGLANQLLDLLKSRKVPVTVFAVGQWLSQNPAVGHRILAEGHELANHTYTHQAMGHLGVPQLADEIVKCAQVLTTFTGSITPWFRPSGIEVPTAAILAEAGKAGYPVSVGYDLDSLDFQDPGTAAVVHNVNSVVKAGNIISLHFGHANTIGALPAILDHLAQAGLTPVTIGTMLGAA